MTVAWRPVVLVSRTPRRGAAVRGAVSLTLVFFVRRPEAVTTVARNCFIPCHVTSARTGTCPSGAFLVTATVA